MWENDSERLRIYQKKMSVPANTRAGKFEEISYSTKNCRTGILCIPGTAAHLYVFFY